MAMSRRLTRHSLAISCAGWSLVVMMLYLAKDITYVWFRFPYFRLEMSAEDIVARNGRPAQRDPGFVFLCDDHASHTLSQLWDDELEASPALPLMKKRIWSREIWAHVIDRLVAAGARVVALDYIFLGSDDGDAMLAAALERHAGQVVTGANFEEVIVNNTAQISFEFPSPTLIPDAAGDDRLGFVNFWPDGDQTVRRAWFRQTIEELNRRNAGPASNVYSSLAAAAVKKAGAADRIPATRRAYRFRYAFKGEMMRDEANKPPSLYGIFVPAIWEANFKNGEFFRDKIVLVGPEGQRNKDVAMSPFGLVAGPELHLNAINALLTGEFLSESPLWVDLLFVALGGMVAAAICRFVAWTPARLGLLVVGAAAWFGFALLLYNRASWIVPVLSPALALAGSGLIFSIWETVAERFERAKLRRTFERYVSRDVVKELLDNPQSYLNSLGGQRKEVSVLFSDVRGFTTITESGDEQALVAQLNEYFNAMVNIVFAHHGTLDKFIGDAVMAQWGGIVTEGEKEDAFHAVATAVEMRKTLVRLNEDWARRGMLELKFGIGVNKGQAIVGNLGCEAKMEVSLIGDAVNTASRLEGMTKQFHVDLLIGETVAPLVRERFLLRTVALSQPKGKTKPLEIFAVLDERAPDLAEPAWLADHEEGVRLFRARDFAAAISRFEAALLAIPGDWLCENYIAVCRELLANPPPPDWKPIDVMTSK